jgi:hypothetical protein
LPLIIGESGKGREAFERCLLPLAIDRIGIAMSTVAAS